MTERVTDAAFLAVVLGASLLAAAARRFKGGGTLLPALGGWALADRRLSALWTWLLLGSTVFTAYTFIAVPGLVFSAGALGFFPLAYTILVCPLMFVLLPRIWTIARSGGHVTAGDFVRGRYGSPTLALMVSLTGILATMPYLALQLVGVRAVLTAGGPYRSGIGVDATMIALFAVPAIATFRHGLRTPALLSAAKTAAIFATVAVAVVLALRSTGGTGPMLDAASARLGAQGTTLTTLGPDQATAFGTLALGSALALPMYPHVFTAGLAASGPNALRKACAALPAWTMVLGLFSLLGIAALATGISVPAGQSDAALPLLLNHLVPRPALGLVFGAIVLGALVPASVMSIAAGSWFTRDVYVEYLDRTATPKRQVRVARSVSLVAKLGAIAFVLGLRDQDAIDLQLLGSVWILQTAPTIVLGLRARRLGDRALLAGWAAGMAAGTVLVVAGGYSSVIPIGLGSLTIRVYAGLAALVLNLAVTAAVTAARPRVPVLRQERH
jgi:solute:Na+ symporter, SSS family